MKNIVLILLMIFTFQLSNAQGTLQFNKVITKMVASSGSADGTDGSFSVLGTFTVPANKIWKINHFTANTAYTINNGTLNQYGGQIGYTGPDDTQMGVVWDNTTANQGGHFFNFYFGAGTHSLYAQTWGTNTSNGILVTFNGIEYNIISE